MIEKNLKFQEKIFVVQDVPKENPCSECKSCLRLKLLELGVIPGQKVKVKKINGELWTLTFINENGNPESRFGLRDEELKRIIFEDDCVISLI